PKHYRNQREQYQECGKPPAEPLIPYEAPRQSAQPQRHGQYRQDHLKMREDYSRRGMKLVYIKIKENHHRQCIRCKFDSKRGMPARPQPLATFHYGLQLTETALAYLPPRLSRLSSPDEAHAGRN